jgi:hypothetical protein
MPTYRNDSTTVYFVTDTSNLRQAVQPGDEIETYQLLDLDGMTRTAEAPYFNPSRGVHALVSSGIGDDQTIYLDPETDEIEIWNRSGVDITCFLRSTDNVPGFKVLDPSIWKLSGLKGYVDVLVLQFAAAVSLGECYLTEMID